MITLEQVVLLEQKVESAVAKIAALTADNADLNRTLGEISVQNADFAKKNAELSEMLALYEEDQSRIEKGILSALNRLNDVENSVLKAGAAAQQQEKPPAVERNIQPEPQQIPLQVPEMTEEKPVEKASPDGQMDIF